jgi:hypothetical protein
MIMKIMKRGLIGIIGFILSPLSWWNDPFVNFPLAYAFAWLIGRLLDVFVVVHEWLFVSLFTVGYFMTNLVGFLMIHYSVWGMRSDHKRNSIVKQILISILYSIVIVAFFSLDLCNPQQGCKILPSWVKP